MTLQNESRPAPQKDRIRGSKENPQGSARNTRGGITVSPEIEQSLQKKAEDHNKQHPAMRVTIGMLKAVYRRGAGAFSVSHRPGKTRNQWAMARVNAFLDLVANGKPNRAAYTTDNDLLPKNHRLSTKHVVSSISSEKNRWQWSFTTTHKLAQAWSENKAFCVIPQWTRYSLSATKADNMENIGTNSVYTPNENSQQPSGQSPNSLDFGADAGERIGGQLCRDKDGQFVNCNSSSATTESKLNLYRQAVIQRQTAIRQAWENAKERQKQQKQSGKELTPEEQAKLEEERQAKIREERLKNIEKTAEDSPLGKDDAKAFAEFGDPDDPKGLTNEQMEKFEEVGLIRRSKDGNLASMTVEGRKYLRALRSGDKASARDIFADVQESVALKKEREAEKEERRKEQEERRKEQEERRKEQEERREERDRQKTDQYKEEQARLVQMLAFQMLDDYLTRTQGNGGDIMLNPSRDESSTRPNWRQPNPYMAFPNGNTTDRPSSYLPERVVSKPGGGTEKLPARGSKSTRKSYDVNDFTRAYAIAQASFRPPNDVQRAARRALAERRKKPPSQRGMTPVGLARARDLASGRPVSLNTITRMNSYFARHAIDKNGSTWDDQGKGWQAWNGWGGDAGMRWAARILRAAEKAMDHKDLVWCMD